MFFTLKTPYLVRECLFLIFTPGLIVYTTNRCLLPLINRYLGVRQGRVNVFQTDRRLNEQNQVDR